jgi:hypothetical protein
VLAAVALAAPGAALAAHGKAGLWKITTTMGGLETALPPEARAQMKAHGISMPNLNTMTTEHCMTPQEVATDQPPPMEKGCQVLNVTHSGGHFSADLKCTGRMTGHGHFEVTYDSPEHYAGHATMQTSAGSHEMNLTDSFEGRWIKADCGSVTH